MPVLVSLSNHFPKFTVLVRPSISLLIAYDMLPYRFCLDGFQFNFVCKNGKMAMT